MAIFDSKKNLFLTGCALAAAVAAFFINIAPETKTGLYENVRKAERYIKEKKYDRGIYYLEMAYKAAPGSRQIGEELARGYLEFARHLNSLGEINAAVEKAAAAYEISPSNLPVINDLAYYLSVRAAEKAFAGRMDSAVEDLEIAGKLAGGHGVIKTNIANYLINRAIDARDSNDIPSLMLFLKTSYTLRPRFETLVFLGVAFYDSRELEKAIFYWEKALALKPDDRDVQLKIEKAEKEVMMTGREKVMSTTDFEVILYGENNFDREVLEMHLIDVYKNVGKDLNYYPPPGTRIIIYGETDFRDIFQKEGIIRGFYDGNIRIALPGDPSEILMTGVLAHEYTHAAISIITENKCPVWLHEGIAVYEQSKYAEIKLRAIEGVYNKNVGLSISEIERSFGQTEDRGGLALAYEGAYTAVLFILEEWGWVGLRSLLDGIREDGHFVNAFDEKFYITVPEFEERWNDFVRKRLIDR